jgi:hypothetical protein
MMNLGEARIDYLLFNHFKESASGENEDLYRLLRIAVLLRRGLMDSSNHFFFFPISGMDKFLFVFNLNF